MSVNLEWDAPMIVKSSYTSFDINQLTADVLSGGKDALFLIEEPGDYKIVPAKLRTVADSLSQADGSSIQPPFIDGLVATIGLSYWVVPNGNFDAKTAACANDLRLMNELLMGTLNALRTFPTDPSTQQYSWNPSGVGDALRLLNGIMLGSWPVPDFSQNPLVRIVFEVASPYPYALNDTPHTVGPITPGDTFNVDNDGNSPGLPVLEIPGPATYFKVTNTLTGLTLIYDHSLPGALSIPSGHTLEINFHEGSCLLDGDPDFDYIAGLDPSATTFWALDPGVTPVSNDVAGDGDVTVVSFNYFA